MYSYFEDLKITMMIRLMYLFVNMSSVFVRISYNWQSHHYYMQPTYALFSLASENLLRLNDTSYMPERAKQGIQSYGGWFK